MSIRALVWGENIHERTNPVVQAIYPKGMHNAIALLLSEDREIVTSTATLQEPEHGLPVERLEKTDVLLWWGHMAHGSVDDEIVERVAQRVWEGMGLILLHSAHFSKIFRRLMGTPCALSWREAGERERLWTVSPGHAIARGIPPSFTIEYEEMYGEPFSVPEPDETVFVSWFQGGEVFRSGLTWRRGAGKIFYFRPGHEAYPTYHHEIVGQVLRNAVHWAHNPTRLAGDVRVAPNVPVKQAPEKIEVRGPSVHVPGTEGFR
ncbi:MAG: ThuA domain-containing protein [Cucumibacter sp.]